jgi:hypothetical protein
MTLKEIMKLIETKAIWPVDGVDIQVIIKDAKSAYGNDLVLIVPVAGKGQKWINVNSIKIGGNL